MALAAYLHHEGHAWQKIEVLDGNIGLWVFRETDGLNEMINDFELRVAEVEPVEFQRSLVAARRALFAELDKHKGRDGQGKA